MEEQKITISLTNSQVELLKDIAQYTEGLDYLDTVISPTADGLYALRVDEEEMDGIVNALDDFTDNVDKEDADYWSARELYELMVKRQREVRG